MEPKSYSLVEGNRSIVLLAKVRLPSTRELVDFNTSGHFVFVSVALFARMLTYNHYTITHTYNAANTETRDKGIDQRVKTKKLLFH